uniref:DUF155 domain-containing protein n=1 Tax=Macrostomum lignano TaxID=282301 RepID=A0A1I8H443_9PLAT
MASKVAAKFVSYRVSQVALASHYTDKEPVVAAGSWDEGPSNRIQLLGYGPKLDAEGSPRLLAVHRCHGDVMCLRFDPIYQNLFVGLGTGELVAMATTAEEEPGSNNGSGERQRPRLLRQLGQGWRPSTDSFGSGAVSALAIRDGWHALAGWESGRLVCCSLAVEVPDGGCSDAATLRPASGCGRESVGLDSCCVTGADFIDQNAACTVNSMGQLKLWDLRTGLGQYDKVLTVAGDPKAMHCARRHPAQPHLVATGASGGCLCLWDLRQEKFPVSIVELDDGHVTQVEFHPVQGDLLFVSTMAGQLYAIRLSDSGGGGSAALTDNPHLTAVLPASQKLPLLSSVRLCGRLLIGTRGRGLCTVQAQQRRQHRKQQHFDDSAASARAVEHPIEAMVLGERLDLRSLARDLTQHGLYQLVPLPAELAGTALMATSREPYTVGGQKRDAVLFDNGAVVLWNMSDKEAQQAVKLFSAYTTEPHSQRDILEQSESMAFVAEDSVGATRVSEDLIQLPAGRDPDSLVLEKFALSDALATSTRLGHLEAQLDRLARDLEPWIASLKEGQNVRAPGDLILSRTGQLYRLRFAASVCDSPPDFYWEREDLEALYGRMSNVLTVARRARLLNTRLQFCLDLCDLLRNQKHELEGHRLEWIIIFLIFTEIIFAIVHLSLELRRSE